MGTGDGSFFEQFFRKNRTKKDTVADKTGKERIYTDMLDAFAAAEQLNQMHTPSKIEYTIYEDPYGVHVLQNETNGPIGDDMEVALLTPDRKLLFLADVADQDEAITKAVNDFLEFKRENPHVADPDFVRKMQGQNLSI